mmetsp:Transcript_14334/g.36613  ORF Transcript_14334/g.36613 Transcript_14334/m.36613 type:complete len:250 (-) Transcript_14334:1417-2166(-)
MPGSLFILRRWSCGPCEPSSLASVRNSPACDGGILGSWQQHRAKNSAALRIEKTSLCSERSAESLHASSPGSSLGRLPRCVKASHPPLASCTCSAAFRSQSPRRYPGGSETSSWKRASRPWCVPIKALTSSHAQAMYLSCLSSLQPGMPWLLMSQTLWSLSAILTSFALRCSDLAVRSCASFLVVGFNWSLSVRLLTSSSTFGPNLSRSSGCVVTVSSRVSCSSATCSVSRSRIPTSARIRATASGWLM